MCNVSCWWLIQKTHNRLSLHPPTFHAVNPAWIPDLQALLRSQHHIRSDPAWGVLHAWQSLPGSSVLLELALRAPCGPLTADLGKALSLGVLHIAGQHRDRPTPASCKAQISLLVSIHKQLLLCTRAINQDFSGSGVTREEQLGMQADQLEALTLAYALLCNVLLSMCEHASSPRNTTSPPLETANSIPGSLGVACQPARAGGSTSSLSRDVASRTGGVAGSSAPGCGSTNLDRSGSSSGGGRAQSESSRCNAPLKQDLHRLEAVTVMVVGWMDSFLLRGGRDDVWGVRCEGANAYMRWEPDVRKFDSELADVALSLALPLQPRRRADESLCFKQQAVAWDRYAVKHFHGRLLPGCSYLGCADVSGSGEAAVATRLCSGCRRTRYCSVECQRAAWLLGGHADMCGKGKWVAV